MAAIRHGALLSWTDTTGGLAGDRHASALHQSVTVNCAPTSPTTRLENNGAASHRLVAVNLTSIAPGDSQNAAPPAPRVLPGGVERASGLSHFVTQGLDHPRTATARAGAAPAAERAHWPATGPRQRPHTVAIDMARAAEGARLAATFTRTIP